MVKLSEDFLSKYRGVTPKNAGVLFYPVYLRTYSRWIPDKQRRETWDETVERVVNHNISLYSGYANKEDLIKEAEFMYDKVFNLEVLPAGRALWVGGTRAAEIWGESLFNCSFATIDSISSITDLFQLLLCGCGVGFRVLEEDICNLPSFPCKKVITHMDYKPVPYGYRKENTETVTVGNDEVYISVGDSRQAWVEALKEFFNYSAKTSFTNITINYDNIRPAGERIKTFGGHAPGPGGLKDMFTNLNKVLNESGGSLSSTDCVDICNYIAKNVIVGGTRRSSQVALGSPLDQPFIDLKKDLWVKKENLQRTMSNNSVVFTDHPTRDQIKNIFKGIRNNGEPGFFNLAAARKRRPNAQGSNPCLTKDSWIQTSQGPKQIQDLLSTEFYASVNGEFHKATNFFSTGIKKVYKLVTKEGYEVKLTDNHKILTTSGWKEAKDLTLEDKIILNNLSKSENAWLGEGTFEEGWLIGSLIGDGTYGSESLAHLRYWGEDQKEVAEKALSYMSLSVKHRSDCKVSENRSNNYSQVSSKGLALLAKKFGVEKGNKIIISPEIEMASSEFYKGFLRGIFDADGSVQGTIEKGRSIRLSQTNIEFLKGVQRMLLRLGIKSTLYMERMPKRVALLPDGKGGKKEYACKALNELVISRSCMATYRNLINFNDPSKKQRLENFMTDHKKNFYGSKFEVSFKSLEYLGYQEVYDCTVDTIHRFDANGIIVHNCMEILLDSKGFCNLSTVNLKSCVHQNKFNLSQAIELIKLATRIGLRTTNVTVSLPAWDYIQKRDRLLGVSLTGIMDAFDKVGIDFDSSEALSIFKSLKESANLEAKKYAFEMRVPAPLLVTTLKPEGTLSQLPTVSSGLHRAYAPYFIRRIRVSEMDPVCKALQQLGVPNEPDAGKSERVVFSFPVKSEAPISADDEPTSRQFKRYLTVMKHYVDHNASCTLTVGESEWEEIENEVYENFDSVVACSFLEKGTTAYPQMPYEAISKEQYDEMMLTFPDLTDLPNLVNIYEVSEYETELEADCSSGACPVR